MYKHILRIRHERRFLENFLILDVNGLLYISTSVWVLHTPNAGRNIQFLQSTSVLVQTLKNVFLAVFCCKFLAFFCFLPLKMLKLDILTSVWSAQHPIAGRNIQHWLIDKALVCCLTLQESLYFVAASSPY